MEQVLTENKPDKIFKIVPYKKIYKRHYTRRNTRET